MFQPFVSKPTEVQAVYWDYTDDVLDALTDAGCDWKWDTFTADDGIVYSTTGEKTLLIKAGVDGAQGYVAVPRGHYVICAAENDFYPCEQRYFEEKYEPLTHQPIVIPIGQVRMGPDGPMWEPASDA